MMTLNEGKIWSTYVPVDDFDDGTEGRKDMEYVPVDDFDEEEIGGLVIKATLTFML